LECSDDLKCSQACKCEVILSRRLTLNILATGCGQTGQKTNSGASNHAEESRATSNHASDASDFALAGSPAPLFNIGPDAELQIIRSCFEKSYKQFQANYPNNWTGMGWIANVASLGTSDAQRCDAVSGIYKRSMQTCLGDAQVNLRFYKPVTIVRGANTIGLGTHQYLGYAKIAHINDNQIVSDYIQNGHSDYPNANIMIVDPWKTNTLVWMQMPSNSTDDATAFGPGSTSTATFSSNLSVRLTRVMNMPGSPGNGPSNATVAYGWSSTNFHSPIMAYGKFKIVYHNIGTHEAIPSGDGRDKFSQLLSTTGLAYSATLQWAPAGALKEEFQVLSTATTTATTSGSVSNPSIQSTIQSTNSSPLGSGTMPH
jgi:hypothetical protein